MDKERKIILAIFSACIVIFFGYWIFWGNSSNSSGGSPLAQSTNSSETGLSAQQSNIPSQFQYLAEGASSTPTQSLNITQSFATNMSSDFITHSQSASTSSVSDYLKGVGSSPQLNQTLSDLSKTSMDGFIQSYPISQIKIISNATPQDIEAYWKAYNNAFKDEIFKFSSQPSTLETELSNAVEGNDPTQLVQMILEYQTILESMKTIAVPTDLVDFQSKNISFLNNYILFLGSFEKVNSDPLRAYYISQNGFPIIQQQADDIATIYKSLKVRYNL
jgi:hypothetical protein